MTDEKKTTEQEESPKPEKKKCGCVRKILLTIIIIILIVSLAFEFFGNKAIKLAVETAGTKVLNVAVTVDDIDLSPLAGSLKINDLVVANPAGFKHPTLLELGNADIKLKTSSLLSDTIEIEHIKLDGMTFTIEQKGLTNNLKTILDSLPKSDEPKDDKPDDKEGKKLHIALLEISGVTVKAKLLPIPGKLDTITLPLPTIKMTDIGGKEEEPVDTAGLITKIIEAISKAIAENGAGILPDDITGSISKVLEKLPDVQDLTESAGKLLEGTGDLGKDALEGTGDLGKGVIDGVKDVGEGLEKGIKGLFGK